jgi:hypothetical protein
MKNPLYWLKSHFSGRIFAKIRQKKTLDQSPCGLFVITYAVDIVFNINVNNSKYVGS